jgi:nicotinamide-nucleotide amidase
VIASSSLRRRDGGVGGRERTGRSFHGIDHPTIAYLASLGEVKVRITAKAPSRRRGRGAGRTPRRRGARALGDVVFSADDETSEQAVLRLARLRQTRTLACAESLTGGAWASGDTRCPARRRRSSGRRSCTRRGEAPRARACPTTCLAAGTVTEACALAMATGARDLYGADVALR